ncbi:PEF-CTERM sorting domain-containing protein [Methanolobus sp. ZRKC3]|uniref:DUF7507 domain-containing protein n=1 Tax=Methanolobus sp. ZRKC3 TaxID=3125786 RepID=UPI003243CB8C
MRNKQNMILCIGVALVFMIIFAGNAVASTGGTVDLEKYTLGTDGVWYDADVVTGPEIPVGNPVKWKYVVTNNLDPVNGLHEPADTYAPGEMVITSLNDEHPAVLDIFEDEDCTIPAFHDGAPMPPVPKTILSGQTVEYFACGIAASGQYENRATVDVEEYYPGPVLVGTHYDEDFSHYFGVVASIDIEKSTNGHDADTGPGPSIPVGDPVLWEYVVTNDGDVPLILVTVADDDPDVAVSCPTCALAPGQSMTCTASGIAVAGQYTNLGTVTAQWDEGSVSNSDPSNYYGGADNEIPEFPTIALPVVAILGLAFIFQRRKE